MSHTQSFVALRHPGFRMFCIGNATAMLADNMEHVVSYWVMNDKFHSASLGGFAVIAHWVPYLLLSVYVGALTSRFDPRRMIQCGMVLFMSVSLAWGLLFATDKLEMWHAKLLLVLHGLAGVLWTAPSQVLLYDIVKPADLQSAVRSNATARYLGVLLGPALGSGLMLVLSPPVAMFINMLVYLPLTLWLWRAPYGPKFHRESLPPRAVSGLQDIAAAFNDVAANRTMLAMIVLAGAAAFFIGNAYQAQMPAFATQLGHGNPGAAYGVLLAADAAGALSAGLILEGRSLLPARSQTALWLAGIWCVALGAFALTPHYAFAVPLLFVAGFVELAFNAMAQTLVQLNAPVHARGRVVGVFAMSASGLRVGSGFTVGLLGSAIGIHASLALSAAVLLTTILGLYALTTRQPAFQNG